MSGDEELDAIRARRLAELQAAHVQGRTPEQQRLEAEQDRMNEQRKVVLQQLLTNEARERLGRIRLVKPEKAQQVEDMVIQAAGSGRLRGKVDEPQLIELLSQIAEHTTKQTKVTVIRRRDQFEDEEEDDKDDD